MGRSDWIASFVDYTSGIKSPVIYRQWSAISTIAGALQRRVWVRIGHQHMFPNLYVLLIAKPGKGKTNAIKFARNIARKIQGIKLTPTRITPRAFYNELQAARGDILDLASNSMYSHHSLTAMIDEFSVFVRPGDNFFMADLADLYDCPDPFEYKTATQGDNLFENAYFNLIGGATPKYLKQAWTNTILDEGFPSRCIVVFSDEIITIQLFTESEEQDVEEERLDARRKQELVRELEMITQLRGRFTWEDSAREAMADWYEKGMPPAPSDPRLEHYCERRIAHITKLCLNTSAARRDDMEITLDDFNWAREFLLHTESNMLEAVQAVGANPMREQMELARKFVEGEHKRSGNGVVEWRLRSALMNEVDPMKMRTLLYELEHAGALHVTGTEPQRRFFPSAKKDVP